jgi:hypothetical protein
VLQEVVSRQSERSTRYGYSSFWICGGQTGTWVGFLSSNSGFPCHHSSSDSYSSLSSWCSALIITIDCEAQKTSDTRQKSVLPARGKETGGKNSSTCYILRIINSFFGLWSALSLQTRTVMSCVLKFLSSLPYWPCYFKTLQEVFVRYIYIYIYIYRYINT